MVPRRSGPPRTLVSVPGLTRLALLSYSTPASALTPATSDEGTAAATSQASDADSSDMSCAKIAQASGEMC